MMQTILLFKTPVEDLFKSWYTYLSIDLPVIECVEAE